MVRNCVFYICVINRYFSAIVSAQLRYAVYGEAIRFHSKNENTKEQILIVFKFLGI